jgi:hypothetical protein
VVLLLLLLLFADWVQLPTQLRAHAFTHHDGTLERAVVIWAGYPALAITDPARLRALQQALRESHGAVAGGFACFENQDYRVDLSFSTGRQSILLPIDDSPVIAPLKNDWDVQSLQFVGLLGRWLIAAKPNPTPDPRFANSKWVWQLWSRWVSSASPAG